MKSRRISIIEKETKFNKAKVLLNQEKIVYSELSWICYELLDMELDYNKYIVYRDVINNCIDTGNWELGKDLMIKFLILMENLLDKYNIESDTDTEIDSDNDDYVELNSDFNTSLCSSDSNVELNSDYNVENDTNNNYINEYYI